MSSLEAPMLKKFIAMLVIFSVFIVHAQASTNEGLKAAYNELNYSLTVDWDQKDKEFHDEQMKKFTAAIRDLQSQGLTNSQLLDFAKSQVNNAQVVKDLEVAFNMIQINKMSGPEANKYILDIFKKSYSTGASWNGDVILSASFIVVVTVLLVVIVKAIVQEIKNPG
jgi:hypothetical protein